jgi:choline dehydrogenase-like flavoprotein
LFIVSYASVLPTSAAVESALTLRALALRAGRHIMKTEFRRTSRWYYDLRSGSGSAWFGYRGALVRGSRCERSLLLGKPAAVTGTRFPPALFCQDDQGIGAGVARRRRNRSMQGKVFANYAQAKVIGGGSAITHHTSRGCAGLR